MFRDFFIKKMVEKRLAGVPPEMREKLTKLISENPEFFMKLAGEIEEEIKKGKKEMDAAQEVFGRHQQEIKNILEK